MKIEKGSLKDWDDRHYQSIDDLPPEAWNAVRNAADYNRYKAQKEQDEFNELYDFIFNFFQAEFSPSEMTQALISMGYKRD